MTFQRRYLRSLLASDGGPGAPSACPRPGPEVAWWRRFLASLLDVPPPAVRAGAVPEQRRPEVLPPVAPPWQPRPPFFAPVPGGRWSPQPAQAPVPFQSGKFVAAGAVASSGGAGRQRLRAVLAAVALGAAGILLAFLLGAFDGPDRPAPPKPTPSTTAPVVPGPTPQYP
ncbi:hypothetical protein [Streptomyces rubellomurinus]|uniref:Uncharacterized protein n=1 Tax=Streptomyces rubellomurinus (strain ATCC 31215) TaxID=359131 RepID=A0A0F2TGM5_STRR3|nr:hypothetical protein [Streptomyces rubellomurinus]KJS61696.1 hypothetical protein VM95_13270 [Streptomyces rubellomurinus]